MSRYRVDVDEKDLVGQLRALQKRVSKMERMPRTSFASIDAGTLRVNQDTKIIVENADGEDIIVIQHTSTDPPTPNIELYPPDSDGSHMDFAATDIDLDFIQQTNVQYNVFTADAVSHGYIAAFETGFQIAERVSGTPTPSPVVEARNLSAFGLSPNLIRLIGRFLDDSQQSTSDALYVGDRTVGAGVSSVTITYSSTFASLVMPLIGLLNTPGGVPSVLTAQSASSFTVAWTGTDAKTVNMWNVRV